MEALTPSPSPPDRLGDAEGITAGRGIVDGLGDTERLKPWPACEPIDDLLLWEVGGGFIGRARDCGVPGDDGLGEPTASEMASCTNGARLPPKSGGAGLFDEMRLPGRSIFVILLFNENCPSLVLSVYICTDRSDD